MFSDVLLTVDYDRTLTAPDSTIPERNLQAIRYFMENGGAFTINTGRSIPMIQVFKDKVPTNAPLLLYNGGAAYDVKEDKMIFMEEIQMDMWETVHELIDLFPDLTVEVQALDKHYDFIPNPAWDEFSAGNCAYATATEGQDLGPFLKFSLYGKLEGGHVDQLFHGTEEEIRRMNEAEALLNRRYGDKVAVYRAGPRIIDAQAKGVSKARSARRLQKELGKKILVCVGDAENDITMLDEADYSFIPADAILNGRYESVCKCADGAVADVIYEKIPEILNLDLDKKK